MSTRFKEVRKLQGERVRMQFEDGREVVAMLLCATKDVDGSKHLVYSDVESAPGPETGVAGESSCVCADGNTLVNIESAQGKNGARTVHGWDYIDLRHCA